MEKYKFYPKDNKLARKNVPLILFGFFIGVNIHLFLRIRYEVIYIFAIKNIYLFIYILNILE